MTVSQITVTGGGEYVVNIGRGMLSDAETFLGPILGTAVHKVLIIHPPTLGAVAAKLREDLLVDREVLLAEVPDAENAKRVEVAAFCWQILGQADFTRSDAIIGLGGGAVTDLAGFVAATWLRGVKLIHIPTTVLAMVDASVGGKTGINTTEGKNLVGAFYAPHAVVCDLDVLENLPRNELLAGFAEIVKCGFIADEEILTILEADIDRATDPASQEFQRLIELSVGVKARVVSEDFTEQGQREILNYGHTLGHAIEHAERYTWRHGAAISIGMMFAAELSRMTQNLPDSVVDRQKKILESLTLPTTYKSEAWEHLLGTMKRDKKARGSMLRFVVLRDIAQPTVLNVPDTSILYTAYQELSE
ncbi:3-dehydroquinate synthase [Aurantimicrobium sp. MWH-Uga1]|uniref:3-dehydroquinate synthase n=1 Tax=Aurantimicrobium sp. MWH-Uga1 TaxID=2079575 RepID=UPI000DEDAEBF|nr:3-dehydroquinate synthase [Aurantimicrobium sp. MWH-Uga1]AXE54554.1 3-dehydroquinate synthase [Aurantimicrobium sp. MWH-Uga1]